MGYEPQAGVNFDINANSSFAWTVNEEQPWVTLLAGSYQLNRALFTQGKPGWAAGRSSDLVASVKFVSSKGTDPAPQQVMHADAEPVGGSGHPRC